MELCSFSEGQGGSPWECMCGVPELGLRQTAYCEPRASLGALKKKVHGCLVWKEIYEGPFFNASGSHGNEKLLSFTSVFPVPALKTH